MLWKQGNGEWKEVILNNVLRKFGKKEFQVEDPVTQIPPEKVLCKLRAQCNFEGKELWEYSNEESVIKENEVSYSHSWLNFLSYLWVCVKLCVLKFCIIVKLLLVPY